MFLYILKYLYICLDKFEYLLKRLESEIKKGNSFFMKILFSFPSKIPKTLKKKIKVLCEEPNISSLIILFFVIIFHEPINNLYSISNSNLF